MIKCIRRITALALGLSLLICAGAYAAPGDETTLTIELKGVSPVSVGQWHSLPLHGRFDVVAGDRTLARLTANPTAEELGAGATDTLTIDDVGLTSVSVVPVVEDFVDGFTCDAIDVALKAGESNRATVFAYAERGLFSVRNVSENGDVLSGAEFMLLDANGTALWSFTTDENGEYTSAQAVPDGEYQLSQMRSAEGVLPLTSPVAFMVTTYFGNDEDLTDVVVTNEPAPLFNANLASLTVASDELSLDDATDVFIGSVRVNGLCDGGNSVPLKDYALSLRPAELLDQAGNALSCATSVFVESVTCPVAASVQALDEGGALIGDAITVAANEPAALDDAASVRITLLNESGEPVLPAHTTVGEIEVVLRYEPIAFLATEASAATIRMNVEADYTFEYAGTDGMSVVSRKSEVAPAVVSLAIPDGRCEPSWTANIEGNQVLLSKETELPDGLALAFAFDARIAVEALPDGARLLRADNVDYLLLTSDAWGDEPLRVTLQAGTLATVALWVCDPCTFPRTLDNPDGYALKGGDRVSSPLLDAMQGVDDGCYIRQSVGASLSTGVPEGSATALLTGVMCDKATGEPCANRAVLVMAQGVTYGALTDETGAFAVNGDASATNGTVVAAIPASAGDPMLAENVSLPQTDYAIEYARAGALHGRITLENGLPVAGASVRLLQAANELAATLTDENGAYRFEQLSPGEYSLEINADESANVRFKPVDGATLNGDALLLESVAVDYAATVEKNFTAVALGCIRCELSSPVTATVTLTGADGEQTTEEAEYDVFTFAGLEAGNYTLRVQLPEGFVATAVNGSSIAASSAYEATLTLANGATLVQQLTIEETATLNGRIDGAAEGMTVTAVSQSGSFTATTDAQGAFAISQLAVGDYTVYAPLAAGKSLPADSQWRISEKGDMVWLSVTAVAGENNPLPDVRFTALTAIEGVAFADANSDGQHAEGEQLMSGVPVQLQMKVGGAWIDAGSTATDTYGGYQFRELQDGAYRVLSRTDGGVYVTAIGGSTETADATGAIASTEITIRQGETKAADIALGTPGALRVCAFNDSSEDGECGEYERMIQGVRVDVLAGDGETVLATGLTDGSGIADIANVLPGSWSIRFTLPEGYNFTGKGSGNGLHSSVAGKSESSVSVSAPVSISAGQTTEVGVSAIPMGSFGGKVWEDINNNGLLDADEPGVAGVVLTLRGERTGNEYTLTSDETGDYCFTGLKNDAYTLTAQIPKDMLFARYSPTGGDLRSVFTVEGTKASRQFNVAGAQAVRSMNVGVINKSTIQGVAFLDLNYNGVYDEGEPGVKGVTVEAIKINTNKSMGKVVTGDDGKYAIGGLRGGYYRLRAILPKDGSIFTVVPSAVGSNVNQFAYREGRRENSIASIDVNNGVTIDTVVGVARGATISGSVFMDAAFDGVKNDKDKIAAGVKVQLVDRDGKLIDSKATSSKGAYTFDGIMPGEYKVRFQRKNDNAFTRYRPNEAAGSHVVLLAKDDYGETESLTVAMDQTITGINAGMLPSSTVAGVLFDDLNDNGIRDEGEPGYTAAKVRLYSEDAEIDLTETVAEDGAYFFDGVMPGTYTVTYLLPEHATMANVAADGNTLDRDQTNAFRVEMGTANQLPLVGAVTLGSFEGYAYHDANGNGQRDEGEELLPGVNVTLASGEEATSVTDADGRFSVDGLRPGIYRLTIALPDGLIFSSSIAASDLTLDTLNTQTLDCPWSALVNRAENAIGAVKPGKIVSTVWLDENRDGQQGEDELRMANLRFELYDELGARVVKTALSTEDGYVTFENVRPSTYTVRFLIPDQAEPAGDDASTFSNGGGQMQHSGIVLAEGETIDASHTGLVSRTSIGGTLMLDENGGSTPVSGVKVTLYQNGGAVAQTLTTATGAYRFDGLWPGDYVIGMERPEGMLFVRPGDPNYPDGASVIVNDDGTTAPIALRMAQHQLNENVILIKPAKVGDYAWLDTNANGLIDGGEPSLNGVTVNLLQNDAVMYTTQTDAWGYYLLEDVYPGAYTLQAVAYEQLAITKSVPELRMISSCLTAGDGASATSDAFSVVSGTVNTIYDLGYVLRDGMTLPDAIQPAPTQDWSVTYEPKGPALDK